VRNLKHPTPADPHSPRKFNQFQQR
jgi:hypothetical protein